MIRIPRLKSNLTVKVVPPDLCFFLSESGYQVLHGKLICLIAPMINGKNSVSSLAKQLKGKLSEFDIECGLLLLESEGYITDARTSLPDQPDVFRDSLTIAPKIFEQRLRKTKVNVLSFGKVLSAPFISMLKGLNIQVSAKASFTVVLVDDYLRKELENFNEKAIRNNRTWMIAKPTGNIFWFGPVFSPPNTGCWRCLVRRLRENLRAESFFNAGRRAKASDALQSSTSSPLLRAGLSFAATETLKTIAITTNRKTPFMIQTFDPRQMKLEKHMVMRFDQCPCCSKLKEKSKRFPAPVVIDSCRKISAHNEEQRSSSAKDTFRNYELHISPLTGIVGKLLLSTSQPNNPVHTCVADHLFVAADEKEELLRRGFKRRSAGKGTTPQQAMTGALCEALERYSGIFRGDEIRIKASFRELGKKAIHPNTCMNFSEAQYENRGKWNQSHKDQDWVPFPFDEKRKIEWTPVWSLTKNKFKYLPAAYCYYGYPTRPDQKFCRADSNGNAAGNTLAEAIVQGFMEVVERDSAALWWYNRIPRPEVNLSNFGFPFFDAFLEHYRMLGRNVWMLDITSDFNIPTFVAVSAPIGSIKPDMLGFSAHFDAVTAATRALMEMNQFLPAAPVTRYRKSHKGEKNIIVRSQSLRRKKDNVDFLKPDPEMTSKDLKDFHNYSSNDFKEDVATCVKFAQDRDLETLVLDQTRSDVGLRVVKVVVPGMRQFWARFGSGRLYDIPVKLGWLQKQLAENQLNLDRILI